MHRTVGCRMMNKDDNYNMYKDDDCSSTASHDDDCPTSTAATSKTGSSSATAKEASALLISASDKAGMAGIDRERINRIMLRESGNSSFMQRQRKLDENSTHKVEDMKRRLEEKDSASSSSNNDWRRALEKSTIDPILNNYRSQRSPISTCVVIDMDAYFFSCHLLSQPHLADIPACVGGQSMISTSNYVARKYGVRAAMPGYLGSQLVKELSGGKESLTFIKSDFSLYKQKSAQVREVLEQYDPNLSMYSLDEAFMDIGPYLKLQLLNPQLSHGEIQKQMSDRFNSISETISTDQQQLYESLPTIHDGAKSLLHSIRQKVKDTTGLTCSAGLCSNFLLAKIASDVKKPNGQHFVGPSEQEILHFANPLPIRKVNGIGRVMEKMLNGVCGIETVKDLYDKRAEVYHLFKPASAQFLLRACIGYKEGKRSSDSTEDESGDTDESLNRKGISHERTFSPTSSWSDMCTRVEGITLSLIRDLRERSLKPKTITLKVKLANFEILSRATTRDVALFQNCNQRQSSQDLVDMVIHLLKDAKREYENGDSSKTKKNSKPAAKTGGPFSVRLLGVRCSNFSLLKDNQSSLDKYRTARSMGEPTEEEADELPGDERNPRVTNPYISPKSIYPHSRDTTANNEGAATSSKRSLYASAPPNMQNNDSAEIAAKTVPIDAKEAGMTEIQCPICQKIFRPRSDDSNAEVNAHIDACLNASTVKEMAKEETRCADARTQKKRKRLTDFFG